MSKKFEIILGYVDKPVAVGGAAASLTDQYNTDKSGFSLVNQTAQTGATVASVISIVKLTAGFTPFLNIKAYTLAATTVFLKITAEYKTNQKFDNGDVLSLIGNVAGIVASITLLAGASGPALVFTGVGVTATAAGIVTSDAVKNLYQSLILPVVEKHFRHKYECGISRLLGGAGFGTCVARENQRKLYEPNCCQSLGP